MNPNLNSIDAILAPSKYVDSPHLQFTVDGVLLDQFLCERYEDDGFVGLIPTTLNWLHSEAEQSVVWSRFLQRALGSTVVPILCCPDDLDFDCTLLVADTRITDKTVEWRGFGFDHSETHQQPDQVGTQVDWLLLNREPLTFDRAEYESVADQFYEWAQAQKANL